VRMGKKTKAADTTPETTLGPRPRLVKLVVRNFRCIGTTPVTIDLDDIVVLVGPNNVGKSSVLKAYEVIMSEGSKAGELTIEDFPSGKVDGKELPEIELHTVVYDNSPGPEWIEKTESGEMLVKEIWRWPAPGKPDRRGYNVQEQRWAADTDKEKVPWGAAAVANSRRPQPHRVDAFASPDTQAGVIVKLLMTAIKERVDSHRSDAQTNPESDFSRLLANISSLQKRIVAESKEHITAVQDGLSAYVGRVFPGHRVVFDPKPEDDIEDALTLFKSTPQLLMGPENGYLSAIELQGSGARRTLLWTAIQLLADAPRKKDSSQRPHVLLLDEPEICLHPSAVREACDLLYSLPSNTENWQIMITTHSPCFVDFARDHTSIVRVERRDNGHITGTTIFRPSRANFDASDRECLKLLNQCDPYVAEFFFGGRSIIVEGDTEYTAFKHVMGLFPRKYEGVHIVRARGKATIVSLCKILNQFGAPYAVLHDSDRPTYQKAGNEHPNPAWVLNESIRTEMMKASTETRLLASVPNFEGAFLGEEAKSDKPYNVLCCIKESSPVVLRITQVLDALIHFENPVPEGTAQWTSVEQLRQEVEKG
jgi:putative ATP-dependent endonuclease of the OLD family